MARDDLDIAVIGAGAAGLAAAIFAAEHASRDDSRIALIERAAKPGAKILISGGGRCNVTNDHVSAEDYWGGSSHTVRKVLSAFSNHDVVEWFRRLGVELQCESNGKLFPQTGRARTVLDALLNRIKQLGIELRTGQCVVDIHQDPNGLIIETKPGRRLHARRVIVATGGLSLPKSGSDGMGLSIVERLGHTLVPTTPALDPLILKESRSLGGRFAEFAGITIDARLRLCRDQSTKPMVELTGSLLFTHFGVSGPVAMNVSRHWLRAKLENPSVRYRVSLGLSRFSSVEQVDRYLTDAITNQPTRPITRLLADLIPARLAAAMAGELGGDSTLSHLSRDRRRHLAGLLAETPLEVTDTRGFSYAEATAGGVSLSEVEWKTMESRIVPGLHLCGEMLDVDGRIGGFNFQWAWSSGFLAGHGATKQLRERQPEV